jgi:hypothetical protein
LSSREKERERERGEKLLNQEQVVRRVNHPSSTTGIPGTIKKRKRKKQKSSQAEEKKKTDGVSGAN